MINNSLNKTKKGRASLIISRTICYIILILITLMCVLPFYILAINASRSSVQIGAGFSGIPGKFFIINFKKLMNTEEYPVIRALFNSLIISGSCAILTTYFSAMTAFGLHLYNFKLKNAAFIFIMAVMMIPTQVSTLGFLKLIYFFNLNDNYIPLIVPSIAAPIVFFFMKQYMESVLPFEVVEAARIDGSNEFRTFNFIVIPIIKPAIAVQAIFAFVSSWNNYFVPALVINTTQKKTIPLLIASLRSADYAKFDLGLTYMLIFIAIIPALIVYLILSKYIIKGVTLGSVKG